jgi:hypothetical protein
MRTNGYVSRSTLHLANYNERVLVSESVSTWGSCCRALRQGALWGRNHPLLKYPPAPPTRACPHTMSNRDPSDPMDHLVPPDEPSRIAPSYAAKAGTNNHNYTAVSVSSQEHGEKTSFATNNASNLSTKPRMYARLQKQWVDGWAAEIASCALSFLALASLVIVLRYFDGYVVTEIPLLISINTLVAILAGVIKSALLLPVGEGMLLRSAHMNIG